MSRIPSASQTVGPFFNFALTTNPNLGMLARAGVRGRRIRLKFRVIDGEGMPAQGDCMLELWQADSAGRYAQTPGSGFQRLRPAGNGPGRLLYFRDRQAWPGRRRRWQSACAAYQRDRLCARIVVTSPHPRLLRGRPGQSRGPRTRTGSRGAPRHTTGTTRRKASPRLGASISVCKATERRSSSTCKIEVMFTRLVESLAATERAVRGFLRRVRAAGDARFRSRPGPRRSALRRDPGKRRSPPLRPPHAPSASTWPTSLDSRCAPAPRPFPW